MIKYGLKLWSTNKHYINTAKELYEKNIYDYIELYAIPFSYDDTINLWSSLDIPYIIHAPHYSHGINFSIPDKEKENIKLSREAFMFADKLNAKKIIFHPGINGDYKETARQIKLIYDERILIENKPYNVAVLYNGLSKDDVCVGYSYNHIKYIIEESNVGFCLDIGHATCASNSLQIDYKENLKKFISLNPYMYHLSDGDINGTLDKHYNIGAGSYDFKTIFSLLPKNATISVETNKASKENLDDFIEDIKLLKEYNK